MPIIKPFICIIISIFILIAAFLISVLLRENESLILKNEIKKQNIIKSKLWKFLEENYANDTKVTKIKNKIYPYLGLKRLSIPMISTVSAGKSSFLNFFLNLPNNMLQIGETKTTKFCIIIRHNKNYKEGKIFNVTIERRAEIYKFNFHKAEEIKEDIKTFIIKRNNLLETLQKDKKRVIDPSLFFIIMEIDTGLFEGEYEKYSELVEFIDVPGLNENGNKNNHYFRNIIPLIKPNFLFPIIILDSTNFESIDTFDIFKELFIPYLSKFIIEYGMSNEEKVRTDKESQTMVLNEIREKSLFLVNKLNLHEKQARNDYLKKIINKTSKEFNIVIKEKENLFVINAKVRNLEVNKFKSFINYTEYVINKGDLEKDTELTKLLIESFKEDFDYIISENIENIKSKYKKEKGYKEYLELVKEYKNIYYNFDEEYFNYFSYLFKKIISNNNYPKKMNYNGNYLKKEIMKKIKNNIDTFLYDQNVTKILKDLNIAGIQLNKTIHKDSKNPLDFIIKLDKIVKELKEIGSDNLGIIKLNKDYEDLVKNIKNLMFIHYILIGSFSSGKSFTLNNMIGYNYNLLESHEGEVTRHAFIVRNSKTINLYKADLVKYDMNYYFNKTTIIASGKDALQQKIKEINKNNKEFSYYILETPIKIFENFSIPQDVKDSIEIIDFPGLNTKRTINILKDNNNLLSKDIINGFIYIFKPNSIGINSETDIFKESIIKQFVYQDSNLEDMTNCLFLFTKNKFEEQKNFYDLSAKNLILDLIEDVEKNNMEMPDILKLKEKINENIITYAKLSNIDYLHYMGFEEKLTNFSFFIDSIINSKREEINNFEKTLKIIDTKIKNLMEYQDERNESFLDKIYYFFFPKPKKDYNLENINITNMEPYIDDFKKLLIKKDFITENYVFDDKIMNKIEEYSKKYLYLKNSLKENEYYNKSFYEDFCNKVEYIMGYSEKIKNRKLNYFLNNILDKTGGVIKITEQKFNMNQNEFNAKYSIKIRNKIEGEINKTFDNVTEDLRDIIKKFEKNITSEKKELNCSGNDPDEFRTKFEELKTKVKIKTSDTIYIIEKKNRKILQPYNEFY